MAMEPIGLPESRTESFRAGILAVDYDVQRGLDRTRVKRLKENFIPDIIGTIVLSRRAGGGMYILDGQHRIRAMVELGLSETMVECKVYDGLTTEQEAQIFFWLNNYLVVHSADKFRARAKFGEPVAVDILKIVDSHGLVVSSSQSDGHVSAVVSLESVYTGAVAKRKEGVYGDILAMTLSVLVEAWPNNAYAMNGELIKGVGMILHRHSSRVTINDLVRKITIRQQGPMGLIIAGRDHRNSQGGTVASGIAYQIVVDYNKGRTRNRLPPWQPF